MTTSDITTAARRLWRQAALLTAVALLGACQMIPKSDVPDAPPPIEQPQVDDTPIVDDVLPTDTERHRIALLVPTTGANSGIGQSLANATTMALLDTNAANVRITTYDTATGARAAAERAIADGNRLVLGPLLSEDVATASQVTGPAGVPMIAFTNDVAAARTNVFVIGHAPGQSVERVVAHARSQGIMRFAGLIPNGEYGQRTSASMLEAVRASGGSVVTMQSFDRSRGSIQAAVRRMQEVGGYQAVLIADSGSMAIQAAPLIRQGGGQDVKLLGTELWNTENAITTTPSLVGSWFASVSDKRYRTWAANYRTRFGSSPYRLSTLGYDSVLLTLRIARDWQPGQPFPVQRLYDSGGFIGVDGAFRFERSGIAERALEVQQVETGSFRVVSPAPDRFAD